MTRPHRRPSRTSRRARPGFEPLEGRTLLSGFTLDSQGNLFEAIPTGQLKIDSGVASFAVASTGTLYDRHFDGQMEQFQGGKLTQIDAEVTAFALGGDGTVYDLHVGGSLQHLTTSGPQTLEPDAVKLVGRQDGTIFYLTSDGRLVQYGPAPGTGVLTYQNVWSSTADFALAPDGSLYWLGTSGLLQHQTPSGWVNIDQQASKLAMRSDGTLFYLTTDNRLVQYGPTPGTGTLTYQNVWSGTADFALAPDGSLYWLATYGLLQRLSPGTSAWQDLDVNVDAIRLGSGSQLIVTTTDNSTFTFTPPFTFSPTSTSSNWSGYVAMSNLGSPQTNSVTAVGGSWTVPIVTGPSSGLAYSSTWVGIDGFGGATVEQVGTEQSVFNGSPVYRAWWEMYSTGDQQPEQVITGMAISPGDSISAAVQYIAFGTHAGQFLLSIDDNSRANDSFSTYQWASQTQNPQPQRNCAEWIMEAPSSIGGGVLPLANFSTVGFTDTWATINGVTGPIYDPSWQSERVVMGSGGVTEASPSALGSSPGTSFTVSFITSVGAGASTAQATRAPGSTKEYSISRSLSENQVKPDKDLRRMADAAFFEFSRKTAVCHIK